MLFNSIEFALFLPVVFALYWGIPAKYVTWRNIVLLLSSCLFYSAWDYKFLLLLLFTCALDFTIGILLGRTERESTRRLLLLVSVVMNLGILCTFKYYNFFIENFILLFQSLGITLYPKTLQVILPVGISFYTFQTLSYTFDVFRKKVVPSENWVTFFTYITFFPQLVAGPIERANHLMPQFTRVHIFEEQQAKDGLKYILWGMFKKVVIADTCGGFADEMFNHTTQYGSFALLLGAIFFSFQIYGDFSGYSDIARGVAKLFGFELMRNFDYPYFSKNIAMFWRKWHISLTSWFRDYLYIPLGGSRGSRWQTIRNIIVVFLASGFWHGANWTFIFWGFLNALYFLPLYLTNKHKVSTNDLEEGMLPSLSTLLQILFTFSLTMLAWIFFRATDISSAFQYIQQLFSFSPTLTELPEYFLVSTGWVILLVVWEWLVRHKPHGLALEQLPWQLRWSIYLSLIWLILFYFGEEQAFIYFQF